MSEVNWCIVTEFNPDTGEEVVRRQRLIGYAEFMRKWRARERLHTLIQRAGYRGDSTAFTVFQAERSRP